MDTPSFHDGPHPSTVRRSNRHARYDSSVKGKERLARNRAEHGRPMTNAKYLSREFVAWDGEGINLPDGSHIYTLLANSKGDYIYDPRGLSTRRIMHFVCQVSRRYADAIHVIYGGGYDFNMWLSDCPEPLLRDVYDHAYATVWQYRVQWRRGKSFWLKLDGDERPGITVYDVVSFFQTSFVKACDSYLGDSPVWQQHRKMIVEQKANRGSFTTDDAATVLEYNAAELDVLVELMTELRERLNHAKLRPSRWDGPGAIASALLSTKRIKDRMSDANPIPMPDGVAEAARYAYFGGRFEVCKYGISSEKVYEYDINSAYPAALRAVPDLARGHWVRSDTPVEPGPDTFALYHVRFQGGDYRYPQPLPFRAPAGSVVFPGDESFYGWYWGPDVYAALAYVERCRNASGDPLATRDVARIELRSSWTFVPSPGAGKPFDWIDGMYLKRQALKKAGDGAHVGYKLALNSLYGKTAQQVGASVDPRTGAVTKPPFHQLEWAGFVTSWCRSQVYLAGIDNLSSVVAYETDALFSTVPLNVKIGSGLGEWEQTEFESLTYVQSGTYFGSSNGDEILKSRGVNYGSLTRAMVERAIMDGEPTATAPLTTFVTAGLALRGRWREWRHWITGDKQITLQPNGKRIALPDDVEGWQMTFAARVRDESHSAEFPIAWINPDPEMWQLEELRDNGYERDYE